MIRRTVAILISIAALLIGAGVAWVALSVPRDVRAEAMLKDARGRLQKGERDAARKTFQEIAKTYPRTDAAAAAAYALFRLSEQEAAELRRKVETIDRTSSVQVKQTAEQRKAAEAERSQREADRERIAELEAKVTALETKLAAVEKIARTRAAPSRRR
jgi:TolA-binding protein